ncbi:MAG TPA: VTC domain-containing protein, partial [Bdellovibrionales bacterium]|nr:VTC domain-containing protein [Bdellovibrionales bacterium]
MLLAEVQPLTRNDSEPTTFVRLEEKFVIPKSIWPEMEHLLNRYSAPSYLEAQTDFNLIESTYYDSAQLKIFTDHFTNRVSRVKVRTRRYAPNGEWKQKSVFIEV